MDDELLREVDREAKRTRTKRSALIREAIREHLKRRRLRELEERHREGYQRQPPVEFEAWDRVTAWPEE